MFCIITRDPETEDVVFTPCLPGSQALRAHYGERDPLETFSEGELVWATLFRYNGDIGLLAANRDTCFYSHKAERDDPNFLRLIDMLTEAAESCFSNLGILRISDLLS